jgi:hypothetical protein
MGSRLLACVLFLGAAMAAAGGGVEAATDAAPNNDEARIASAFMARLTGAGVSLTGFHCGNIAAAEDSAAEFADPDYGEAPLTVGLELFPDAAVGAADDGAPAEWNGPLSARLKRIMVEGDGASLTDGAMEEVSLSEASMSVADLIDRCRP